MVPSNLCGRAIKQKKGLGEDREAPLAKGGLYSHDDEGEGSHSWQST